MAYGILCIYKRRKILRIIIAFVAALPEVPVLAAPVNQRLCRIVIFLACADAFILLCQFTKLHQRKLGSLSAQREIRFRLQSACLPHTACNPGY